MSDNTRFPLSWPQGWPRTPPARRKPAKFSKYGKWLTTTQGLDRLKAELERLGAREVLVSTNIELNRYGDPYSRQPSVSDVGVAAYFKLNGKDRVLACDRWTTTADNLAGIAAHIECVRGIDRYGVGTLDQAFAGYDALPPPGATAKIPWRKVFGFAADTHVSAAMVDDFYKTLAKQFHPDLQGGSTEAMAMLNAARDEALAEIA